MLLGIDIGNTNIVLGIFDKNNLTTQWRVSTDEKKTEDEYAGILSNFFNLKLIKNCVLSSVVPNLNPTFKHLIKKHINIKPFFITSKSKMNINLVYPNPSEIGADRIVNAAAAVELYKAPLIIIDFGTATTFCFVDKNNNYLGGIILPGIPLMINALHRGTAKLPEVEIKKPDSLIGKNTIESIQSGLYYQTVGSINFIINSLLKQYDSDSTIIMTGGLSLLFKNDINKQTIIDQDLTLKGLNILYNLNKGDRR